MRDRLKLLHNRIARLGEALLEAVRGPGTSDVDLVSQATKVEAAKAALKSKSLKLEIAEIELKTYLEVTFPRNSRSYERAKERTGRRPDLSARDQDAGDSERAV